MLARVDYSFDGQLVLSPAVDFLLPLESHHGSACGRVIIPVFKTGGRRLSAATVGSTPTRFRQLSTLGGNQVIFRWDWQGENRTERRVPLFRRLETRFCCWPRMIRESCGV
jgi:hypothetical protein